MKVRRSIARMLPAALVALTAVACSSNTASAPASASAAHATPVPTLGPLSALPSGFPTTFVDERTPGPLLLTPITGGLRGHYAGKLVAKDGTTGTYTAVYVENRVPATKVTCGKQTYLNVFTDDNPTVTTEVTFAKWGKALLLATKRVVVFPSALNGSSTPACEDLVGGTYQMTFTAGPTPGIASGTWQVAADGSFVFGVPTAARASPASGG